MWARDGRELFYRNGEQMMVVAVQTRPTFNADLPRVLFEGQYARVVWRDANYDVSPDGQRFLMIRTLTDETSPSREIIVSQNWLEELKAQVPTR